MSTLAGKVAFISGAARGQGRSHALRLASLGADIIALDICADIETMSYPNATKADLDETVRLVEALDRRIVASVTDVRDGVAVQAAFDAGFAQLGRVDIVLPQAGIVRLGSSEGIEADLQAWQDTMDVNVTGAWHTVRAALPAMVDAGRGGSIVFTGSTAALRPSPAVAGGPLAYTASKYGVKGMMKALAARYAADSIRVNAVHPTGVWSGMTNNPAMAAMMAEAAKAGQNAISGMLNALPIDILQPSDISDAIAFLVSDEAKYLTGVDLPVDAGFSIL
jgi:SDR family mycofactocin-dependent oxidoreductase